MMVSSGEKRSVDQGEEIGNLMLAEPQIPVPKKRCDAQAASQRHIKTEQARRDKISAGFQALQDLMPGHEKVEKAMLLTQAADYIYQLQAILQTLMNTGAINKLPDNLQWQIRTLLPRKEAKVQAGNQMVEQAADLGNMDAGQQGFTPQGTPQTNLAAAASMQLPNMPLTSQVNMGFMDQKDLPKDEGALYAQVQNLLHQQQQQAVAAQQIQHWQQTLQALQLQQVLAQQQGQVLPDLVNSLCGFGALPMSSLPLQASNAHGLPSPGSLPPDASLTGTKPGEKDPSKCFADDLPRCGLQQLVDIACENSLPSLKASHASPHKARKSNVKVRRHTTAARIPKPQTSNPARVGQGRPEPV